MIKSANKHTVSLLAGVIHAKPLKSLKVLYTKLMSFYVRNTHHSGLRIRASPRGDWDVPHSETAFGQNTLCVKTNQI